MPTQERPTACWPGHPAAGSA